MITGMLLASIGLAGCGKKSEDDITNKEIYQDDLEPLTEEELNEMDADTSDEDMKQIDEPEDCLLYTSAYIDPENEALVQKAISTLTVGKTLIVIAHRLSTIVGADNIVVVKDGTIHAQGTHEKLLETCPLYRDMWQAHIGAKDQM